MGIAALLAGSVASGPVMAAEGWPSQISANYAISFNGFTIGSFDFKARIGKSGYELDGDAQISALLGLVSWRGLTHSSGRVKRAGPLPKDYSFDFRSSAKTGFVKIGFGKTGAENVSMIPPIPTHSDEVPLTLKHLKGALDPLSTVMALTRGSKTNPCTRRLPVFDGKQRFDLQLSYKRQEAVGATRVAGQPGIVIVCGVKYQPIAGYRPTSDVKQMAASTDIEVSLRPIPSANLFIPHKISIPTSSGYVTLGLNKLQILTNDRQRIALVE